MCVNTLPIVTELGVFDACVLLVCACVYVSILSPASEVKPKEEVSV